MTLKADRLEHLTDLSFYKVDATAEAGVIVVHDSGGSGAAMDDSLAKVKNVSAYTDKPAGLLLQKVVNNDLTKQPQNHGNTEVQLGGKVLLLRRGWVVTDQVSGTPVIGEKAYFQVNGKLITESQTGASPSVPVGRWLSVKDSDGYAKVEINIV